jgi:hypothetical protein
MNANAGVGRRQIRRHVPRASPTVTAKSSFAMPRAVQRTGHRSGERFTSARKNSRAIRARAAW